MDEMSQEHDVTIDIKLLLYVYVMHDGKRDDLSFVALQQTALTHDVHRLEQS